MKCEFCQGDEYIEDEYGEWKLEAVKHTPLPPIILRGEVDRPPVAEPPYWSLFLKYIDEGNENAQRASFPINYCPVCGRRLAERVRQQPLTPEEWIKRERARRQEPGYAEKYAEKVAKQAELFRSLDEFGKTIKENEDGSVEAPLPKDIEER